MCIPLCASILFVLPAGNHPNAISARVSYACIRNHNPKYAPPAGHHRVVLSISAPVNKNHCGFQVVFLHFGALLLQSLQHQSSLLLNFLPPGNQLIHIILFVQLSSHCLRIQLPHLQRAFAAHHVLGHRSPLRHSRATVFPLPSCTFSARHLWVTVIFGRGKWFSCTSPRCCFSLFNISLPYCLTSFRLAIT